MEPNFIEKRRFYRLPFGESLLLTDNQNTVVGGALNISRGGVFLKTLKPLPLDSVGHVSFVIPGQETSICFKAKVAHLVFDRQRAEVDCGMGLQFIEIDVKHQQILDQHIEQEKQAYLALDKVLKARRPAVAEIEKHLQQLKFLRGSDLSTLRYRVARICTIFETGLMEDLGSLGRNS
ncbi:MAG: PilZ domain-containing protein [Pseudomonadota bacterium]